MKRNGVLGIAAEQVAGSYGIRPTFTSLMGFSTCGMNLRNIARSIIFISRRARPFEAGDSGLPSLPRSVLTQVSILGVDLDHLGLRPARSKWTLSIEPSVSCVLLARSGR